MASHHKLTKSMPRVRNKMRDTLTAGLMLGMIGTNGNNRTTSRNRCANRARLKRILAKFARLKNERKIKGDNNGGKRKPKVD
jgi:hypothetical protein